MYILIVIFIILILGFLYYRYRVNHRPALRPFDASITRKKTSSWKINGQYVEHTLLIALGIGLISSISLINRQVNHLALRNIEGIDMVVGAKGSPLQIILSSVYHIDSPTGNISMAEAMRLARNPIIEKAIPLAYGDNYRTFRIVGTDTSYIGHYQGRLSSGRLWENEFEVILGTKVATILRLNIGDEFLGSHGLVDDYNIHDGHPYKVVGILAPSNSVLDQLILTGIESVWKAHEEGGRYKEHVKEVEEGREITALLVKFRNKGMGMFLPRTINENTNMQAALPAIEINDARSLLGYNSHFIKFSSIILLLIVVLGLCVRLINKKQWYHILQHLLIGVVGGLCIGRIGFWLIDSVLQSEPMFKYEFFTLEIAKWELIILGVSIISWVIFRSMWVWAQYKKKMIK